MSKWTKMKVALLAATAVMAAFQFGGCGLGSGLSSLVVRDVVIANIFD